MNYNIVLHGLPPLPFNATFTRILVSSLWQGLDVVSLTFYLMHNGKFTQIFTALMHGAASVH